MCRRRCGDGVRSRSTRRAALRFFCTMSKRSGLDTNARAAPTAITVAIPLFSHPPTTTSHVSQVLLHTTDYSPHSLQRRRICRTGKRRIAFQDEWGSFHDCPPLYYIMANLMDEQVSPKTRLQYYCCVQPLHIRTRTRQHVYK